VHRLRTHSGRVVLGAGVAVAAGQRAFQVWTLVIALQAGRAWRGAPALVVFIHGVRCCVQRFAQDR
jgi:hypothetical protein